MADQTKSLDTEPRTHARTQARRHARTHARTHIDVVHGCSSPSCADMCSLKNERSLVIVGYMLASKDVSPYLWHARMRVQYVQSFRWFVGWLVVLLLLLQ